MREVFLLMKYNLTTLKIYSKQGRKFNFFCQIGLKYRKIVFKYWKYILNTLKSVSKYIWFGKGMVSTEQRRRSSVKLYQISMQEGMWILMIYLYLYLYLYLNPVKCAEG